MRVHEVQNALGHCLRDYPLIDLIEGIRDGMEDRVERELRRALRDPLLKDMPRD